MLTQEYVKELFDYHEDGYLIWKVNKRRIKKGSLAGYLNQNNYLLLSLKNRKVL